MEWTQSALEEYYSVKGLPFKINLFVLYLQILYINSSGMYKEWLAVNLYWTKQQSFNECSHKMDF